jgi:hypothetical protein
VSNEISHTDYEYAVAAADPGGLEREPGGGGKEIVNPARVEISLTDVVRGVSGGGGGGEDGAAVGAVGMGNPQAFAQRGATQLLDDPNSAHRKLEMETVL